MMHARKIEDFQDLVARGDWEMAAGELAPLHPEEIASHLEGLEARQRSQLFSLLPQERRVRVFAALSPAKQNRELVQTLAAVR